MEELDWNNVYSIKKSNIQEQQVRLAVQPHDQETTVHSSRSQQNEPSQRRTHRGARAHRAAGVDARTHVSANNLVKVLEARRAVYTRSPGPSCDLELRSLVRGTAALLALQ